MPITFTTKSYADITMLNDVGTTMLEMIDFGYLVPGAIAAKDVNQALTNLQKNLANKKVEKDLEDLEDLDNLDEEEKDQPIISLSTRAIPLLKLLDSAYENGNNVSWC